MINKVVFILLGLFVLFAGYIFPEAAIYFPGVAIVAGLAYALIATNPYVNYTAKLTSPLLGAAIVGMGFGMDLPTVLQVGGSGFIYTCIGIVMGIALGVFLGKRLNLTKNCMLLISIGTSICGGSAIAAAAPVLKAKAHEIALATAVVFILNAVGLLIFPWIGHYLGFSELEFGTWAALAIHDTSSVVGATMQYGSEALEVGTTVKLARALWIVPVTLVLSCLQKDEKSGKRQIKVKVPWFIPGFLAAAFLCSYVPGIEGIGHVLQGFSKNLMILTLFLIGANLNLAKIREMGVRPLVHGVILWVILATIWALTIYFKIIVN